jgi:hypothetical protein
MRNFKLIYSELSASGPSILSIIFSLESKRWGEGIMLTEAGKAKEDLENLLVKNVKIDLDQQSM